MKKVDYKTITTESHFNSLYKELQQSKIISLDLETSSLDPNVGYVVGMSISTKEETASYIPIAHNSYIEQLSTDFVFTNLKDILTDSAKIFVIFNAKFDTRFLIKNGIYIPTNLIDDSMLQTLVAAEFPEIQRFKLKEIVQVIYKHRMVRFDDLFPKGTKDKNIANVPIDIASPYACEDADYSLRIFNQNPEIRDQFIYKLEKRLWPYVQKIEDTGFPTDKSFCENMSDYLIEESKKVKDIIFDMVAQALGRRVQFNIASFTQLQEILFDMMKLPARITTKSGQSSTSELALGLLAKDYPICQNILTYRSMVSNARTLGKNLVSFIAADGRIHTQYNQAGATSGRFGSSKPNLQNQATLKEWEIFKSDSSKYKITVNPRDAFISLQNYYLIEFDFEAIEFIIMAAEAGEESILAAYAHGEDVHKNTASQVLHKPIETITKEERDKAKTWNYLIIYGGGAYGLALRSDREEEEASEEITQFFQTFPKLALYRTRIRDKAVVTKRVCTHFGRWQWVPELFSSNHREYSKGERACVNRIIQGTAADIHKMGLIKSINRSLKDWSWDEAGMVAQTHDSQTWMVNRSIRPQEFIPPIKEAMSVEINDYPRIRVAEKIGISWGSMEKYNSDIDYSTKFPEWDNQRLHLGKESKPIIGQLKITEPNVSNIKLSFINKPTRDQIECIRDILKAFPGQTTISIKYLKNNIIFNNHPTRLTAQELQDILLEKSISLNIL